jgi:excisionase family DNA binding protein
MKTSYLSLESLAANLDLPQSYLRGLANSHQIPFLLAGNRRRFNEAEVRQALSKLSQSNGDRRSRKVVLA